jgi:hypothetical protein
MSKKNKIDLTLLQRLQNELEQCVKQAETLEAGSPDCVVALSKASGLAAGITQEASLLMLDIFGVMKGAAPPLSSSEKDLFEQMMGVAKGSVPGSGSGNIN